MERPCGRRRGRLDKKSWPVFGSFLGHAASACLQSGLPPITAERTRNPHSLGKLDNSIFLNRKVPKKSVQWDYKSIWFFWERSYTEPIINHKINLFILINDFETNFFTIIYWYKCCIKVHVLWLVILFKYGQKCMTTSHTVFISIEI